MTATTHYPASPAERSRWIIERRGARNPVRTDRPYAQLLERERMEDGTVAPVATIFLTNRECPWTCVMCDLWRNTAPALPGSIPQQMDYALRHLPAGNSTVLKLYNSGSFFDPGAIPTSDWPQIAKLAQPFHRVIVECHPRLVNRSVLDFAALLSGSLEVALGLETCHPRALEKLNKRITLADYQSAAALLRANNISVRTFLLAGVPFIRDHEQEYWIHQSIHEAFAAGSNVVSLIPTRLGNGALDNLAITADFREPRLAELEAAHEFGLERRAGRVFADTWNLARFSNCDLCASARRERLDRMNLSQQVEPRVECSCAC